MKLLESKQYISDLNKALSNMDLSILDNKSIFITGGMGLIGSSLVDLLLTYGKLKAIYIGTRYEDEFLERYENVDGVYFIEYDATRELNIDIKPDYIIHGAGIASPELYVSKPVETVLTNFDGVHNLLKFVKENEVQRMLYISSSEVYGKKNTADPFIEGQYGEIDIDNIRSSYAVAKRASEMICKAYAMEYGLDTVIVRPGHIYGPTASKYDKRISSDFAYKAALGQKLEMKSAGLQKRSYCYSVDCAAQILTVLLKGKTTEAYNVSHDEVTTIKEMAEYYAKAGEVILEIAKPKDSELKAFNPMDNSSLNNEKIKELGYIDSFTVEEGLTNTVKILKEII